MESIAKIRKMYHVDGKAIKAIAKELNILLVNEELVDEDQNQQVLGVSKPRSTAYIST
ncbi:hypothetical protein [Candidatus Tisiphia endosymbiont of Ditula angustiorana]|uniref:hypothetical protein n=1 Tax=Candidatus Tisiphia endosymbiont of Ditula angustiorana TaxID=3066272 RepID=UPI00312C75DB